MKMSQSNTAARRGFRMVPAAVTLAILGFCNVAEAISVRFLPMNEEVAGRKIGLHDSKGLTELKDLNPKKRSKSYQCSTGDSPATLVALDRERPGGRPSGVEITFAPGLKSPLVLILPDADHPSGIRAITVEDGDAFPWGGLRFVNATKGPLMIRCEKETVAIPESFAVLEIAPGGDARNIGVQLFSEEEPDAILYSAVWEHDPTLRKVIFIVAAEDPLAKELTLEIIPQDKRSKE